MNTKSIKHIRNLAKFQIRLDKCIDVNLLQYDKMIFNLDSSEGIVEGIQNVLSFETRAAAIGYHVDHVTTRCQIRMIT